MALASLFTLLDDVTAMLDDVALMTKITAKKATGLVGDDLALNAEQVVGVQAERELPVVWAVAKGSFINKTILVPLAILIAYFMPVLIPILLMCGGAFLCFEGVEKIIHTIKHRNDKRHTEEDLETGNVKFLTPEEEKVKIRGAVRTDFILSAEIIAIALGMVADSPLATQIMVLVIIAFGMTIVVYGLVGGIVKLDDIGLWMMKKKSVFAQKFGAMIIRVMPYFMRALAFVGTLAMFLVGGGILAHNFGPLHHYLESINMTEGWGFTFLTLIIGLVFGAIIVVIVTLVSKLLPKKAEA